MFQASSFTFASYDIDRARSIVSFHYKVTFKNGRVRTYTDQIFLPDIEPSSWDKIPVAVLESTLQALLLILGINYWCVFRTKYITIEGFSLTREQACFWDKVYLNGLGEFFFDMKIDFRGLIFFPYDTSLSEPQPARYTLPSRALLLNGAGKDSILSAELLKASKTPFDFFAFEPTPAHKKIATLVGAKTISVTRRRDRRLNLIMGCLGISNAYPSVTTFTFVSVLLAELLGYDSIVFSNERSADFGNFSYLGLAVNHQWCKSSEAEQLTNDYIKTYITPDITTKSLLRAYSELEIVRRFVQHPQYLHQVTSCNTYFWLPRYSQLLYRNSYWCNACPKCVFLFACFSAFLPKKKVMEMFGANLYTKKRLLPLFKSILGMEGTKPLDCVGEPEEMILAMHYALRGGEYKGDAAMRMFEEFFSKRQDFAEMERRVMSIKQ
ncbi:MAG: hypothetical protein RI911_74 [Candidatus Parcubacteria bacterium]|jgi:hypothetical protein